MDNPSFKKHGNPLPDAGTITGTATVCPDSVTTLGDTATGGTWSTGNTNIATIDNAGNVTGISSGSVTISYSLTNGCGTAAATVQVTVLSQALCGVGTVPGGISSLGIYPNPNTGVFTLQGVAGVFTGNAAIEITDMLGQTVYHGNAAVEKGMINSEIALSKNIAPGVYSLHVFTSSETTRTIRFTVIK